MDTSTTSRPAKRPWTGGEKFLLGAILFLVILVITGMLWRGYVNAMPSVTVPTPAMPSPNAYDYFVAAGNAVVDGDKIGYAIESPRASHTNQGPDHVYTRVFGPAPLGAIGQPGRHRRGREYPVRAAPGRGLDCLRETC